MSTDVAEVVGAALGLIPAVRHPAVRRRADRGRRRLRDPRPAADGLPAARGRRSRCSPEWCSSPSGSRSSTPARTPARWPSHLLVPGFGGTESVLLATGIIGATVMPHVVYLHSALTQRRIVGRNDDERRRILGFEKVDVVIAMTIAGVVNLSMMIMAASLFNQGGLTGIDSIEGAFAGLQQTVSGQRGDRSSASPCWPRDSPPPRWGRWPARSSCRDSSSAGSRSSCGARSPWRRR